YGTDERPQQDQQPNVEKIMEKFRPTLPKGVMEKDVVQARGHLLEKPAIDSSHNDAISNSQPKVPLPPQIATPKPLEPPDRSVLTFRIYRLHYFLFFQNGGNIHKKQAKDLKGDEVEKSCQLEFGSYCLWSVEHKEVMKDSTVKRLKDQLFVARAYYPSIAKLRGQENLTRELKQSIQDHERVLSVAIVDADLPPLIEKKVKNMEQTIARAKSCSVDCNNIDKKLRQILYLTEDETHFHMKQSAFLYRLGVQTMPKSLHCLSMRLTVEYFRSPPADSEHLHAHKFDTPKYRHYIIFSRNILAASVAINSTVMSSEVTGNMVFHLLTDAQNYYAMKLWCSRHSYKEAVLRVINFESLVLKKLHNVAPQKLFLSEEFRVSIHNMDQPTAKMRTEYLSVFSHSHFFLPEIFKNLQKVVILDDDVVVQRDLSPLWNLDLGNKVNGAAKFCGVRLRQLRRYLGKNIYDADSCAWMSGLNIIDLENWRKNNITEKYLLLLEQFQGNSEASLQASAFPISLLAFQNLIYPLDNKWTLSGFGYDYGLEADDARNAVSLHYNGNMKPWLDLGIPEYKKYWKKFLTRGERFMDECNAHP
ncbi:putative galacturonosyltransferase 7, partial [Ananas comosus]